jgi:hypothetical protein
VDREELAPGPLGRGQHARALGHGRRERLPADDVRAGRFPTAAHTYAIAPEVLETVRDRLSNR